MQVLSIGIDTHQYHDKSTWNRIEAKFSGISHPYLQLRNFSHIVFPDNIAHVTPDTNLIRESVWRSQHVQRSVKMTSGLEETI